VKCMDIEQIVFPIHLSIDLPDKTTTGTTNDNN
jgi:hypothetical protein